MDSLIAKANTGSGVDQLAGFNTAAGFAGAVVPIDSAGNEIVPATQASLAALLAAYKAEDTAAVSGDLGLPMLAMRQLADTTSTDNDGDYTLIKIDEEGRVKVATKPASYPPTTGSITTNGGIVWINCARASNIVFSMVATSLVGHAAAFEVSNNTTNGSDGSWYGMQAIRSNANTIETATGTLAATPYYGWEVSVNGWNAFRVRATAHTSGTAAYTLQPGSYATEPIPAAQVSATQPVSGTVTNIPSKLGTTSRVPLWATGQHVAIGATSAKTAAITGTEALITVSTDCFISIGTQSTVTATAGAGSMFLAKGGPYLFQITSGQGVAVIQASAAGTMSVLPVT